MSQKEPHFNRHAAMAEWLRRLTRNQMGSSRVGSNPTRSGSNNDPLRVFNSKLDKLTTKCLAQDSDERRGVLFLFASLLKGVKHAEEQDYHLGRLVKYHREFDIAAIAQLGERQTEDLKVPGSIPGRGIFN